MNTRRSQSALAGALQVSLPIILICVSVILLATSFRGATSKVLKGDSMPPVAGEDQGRPPGSIRISPARELSLADRVAYQRAIEEVYWRHRIWPKDNPVARLSFNEAVPRPAIEEKVEQYL